MSIDSAGSYDESKVFPYTGYGPGLRWFPDTIEPAERVSCIIGLSEGLLAFGDSGESHVRIWKSYGASWKELPNSGIPDRFDFSAAADGLEVVLAGGCLDDETYTNEIWRSSDGGRTWRKLKTPPYEGRICANLAVSRTESGNLALFVAGGMAEVLGSDVQIFRFSDLWYSPDSGESWVLTNIKVNVTGLSFFSGRLFGNIDRNFCFSDDFGSTWRTITKGEGSVVPFRDGRAFAVMAKSVCILNTDGSLVKLTEFAPHPQKFNFFYLEKELVAVENQQRSARTIWRSPEILTTVQRDYELLDSVVKKANLSQDSCLKIRAFMV